MEALRQSILYGVMAVAIILAFFTGYFLASSYSEAERLRLEEKLKALEEEKGKLESLVKDLRGEKLSLETQLEEERRALEEKIDSLLARLDEKERELGNVTRLLNSTETRLSEVEGKLERIREAAEILRTDKELLVLLTSEIPDEREEAERFWNDTRSLIERIEPNLVPSVDKILYYLDYYFDWLEARPEEQEREAICDWIFSYTVEADQYSQAVNKFKQEIYNLIISHINEVMGELD